ncbi:hypothetical protein DYY67_0007 [Candidatus Nitrosotalea sp. TS]|uniref:hypothetical protein n=1 Tax=Candidatus Nitrosotalea sp. TS TaxID=2341020 RepID=UPI00140E2417|nr:hypothetical protein [Candidatus Nitrosotalea sp. TS]NHI02886.1 hypothetical protein [Candidatus Nitrosotalea sp. TS]
MATIGKCTGVALINGRKVYGFRAWLLWRLFYWSHLPTNEKKVKVAFDWLLHSIFRADIMTVGFIKKKTLTRLEPPCIPYWKEARRNLLKTYLIYKVKGKYFKKDLSTSTEI